MKAFVLKKFAVSAVTVFLAAALAGCGDIGVANEREPEILWSHDEIREHILANVKRCVMEMDEAEALRVLEFHKNNPQMYGPNPQINSGDVARGLRHGAAYCLSNALDDPRLGKNGVSFRGTMTQSPENGVMENWEITTAINIGNPVSDAGVQHDIDSFMYGFLGTSFGRGGGYMFTDRTYPREDGERVISDHGYFLGVSNGHIVTIIRVTRDQAYERE